MREPGVEKWSGRSDLELGNSSTVRSALIEESLSYFLSGSSLLGKTGLF